MDKLIKLSSSKETNKKILLLGYGKEKTRIVEALIAKGVELWHTEDKTGLCTGFDLIISFGYRHILSKKFISSCGSKIVNLHASYLPYNRGAHPNFWAFFDNTPSGVTIHLIDEGIDTGPILYQKMISFSQDVTFNDTYHSLIAEMENLFIENLDNILSNKFEPKNQRGKGTYHTVQDLPKEFRGWDTKINEEIERLSCILGNEIENKLKLIDAIEEVRNKNNVNWMDLLRLAFKSAPDEAKKLVQKINTEDNQISDLFKKLSE